MNQINELPTQDYEFGLEFNYAVWTSGTEIDLLNVPWNNDYRDVVKFGSRTLLNNYIDSIKGQGVTLKELSYVKPNTPIRVPLPINKVIKYNYLRAINPNQPLAEGDDFKRYFYFITDVRYIAPNTTEIVVQLDVFQTFIYDVKFGNCYIERGHIGIANVNNFYNKGRDYLTIPEGLDIGGEYEYNAAASGTSYSFTKNPNDSSSGRIEYSVLAISTVDLSANPGTVEKPILMTARGGEIQNLPSGATMYAWENTDKFSSWLSDMSNKSWVTQGIISVTAVPELSRYTTSITWPSDNKPVNMSGKQIGERIYEMNVGHLTETNWREIARNKIPERYRHLNKFLTYPYMIIEWTNYSGGSVIFKPEFYLSDTHRVRERIGIVPPDIRIAYMPIAYNGEEYNAALWLKNLPKMPVVNNMAISYLASNSNSIPFQYKQADWAQQRALGAAQATYDNVSSGMNLSNELTSIGINADSQGTAVTNQQIFSQAMIGTGQNVVGALGSGLSGNPGGVISNLSSAIAGNLSGMVSQDSNNQQLAIRNATANASNQASVGNTGFVRDTNKNLADWAANGDYAMAIGAINAKVQDASMIQPSAAGAYGGETFVIAQGYAKTQAKVKQLTNAVYRTIGEYWLRYGYAVQQFARIPTSLKVMSKFSYWKLSETYLIAGGMPETYKQSIRGIFEKGVTVWSDPTDIGNVDTADNEPLENIFL